MSIKLRFALLLGALLLAFLLALLLLQEVERQEQERVIASYRLERTTTLERLLELSGQNLRQLANDYSLWDEMVQFVASPTDEWARINLEPSLVNFDASRLWVLDAAGRTVWTVPNSASPDPDLPLDAGELMNLTARNPFAWFFAPSDERVQEVRIAPIQPSDDINRNQTPRGWLVVSRDWDEAVLETIGALTESRASLPSAEGGPAVNPAAGLDVVRPLLDWRGRPVRMLHVAREIPEVAHRMHADGRETRIFVGFGVLTMLLVGVALHSWVVRPLTAIEDGLAAKDATPLARLRHERNELGRVAQLVEKSFAQREALEHEIEERRRIEEALRESESSLRSAVDERVRLGRDLHDSVIQSIYAAGLGLAAVRSLLPGSPEEAERRLEQVRQTLNDTIRDLRNFIMGLEPEVLDRLTLQDAIRALVDLLQNASPLMVELEIDERAAEQLPPSARANLLQIVREALSNVWRHAAATGVRVSLTLLEARVHLSISDNGRGFDSSVTGLRGRGLTNMTERARAAHAQLQLDSTIGKGTRLNVSFPLIGGSQ